MSKGILNASVGQNFPNKNRQGVNINIDDAPDMTTSTKHISNIIHRIRTCVQLNNEVHEMVKNDKLNLLIKKKKKIN